MIGLTDSPINDIDFSEGVEHLSILYLVNTKLNRFDGKKLNTPSIKALYLDQNNMELFHLPGGFNHLSFLSLDDSNVKCFSAAPTASLEQLSLQHNRITEIDVTGFPNLRILNLVGNARLDVILHNYSNPQTLLYADSMSNCSCCLRNLDTAFNFLGDMCLTYEKNCSIGSTKTDCEARTISCKGKEKGVIDDH